MKDHANLMNDHDNLKEKVNDHDKLLTEKDATIKVCKLKKEKKKR